MNIIYKRVSPCNNCPYRINAPLRYWSAEEFKQLLLKDKEYLGTVYRCHKNDGHVCVGWLMDQDKRNHPSIALRISLSKNKVTRTYLDKLKCKSKMYSSIEEMCKANYPEEFTDIKAPESLPDIAD
jgi:translation elongation factor EF-4